MSDEKAEQLIAEIKNLNAVLHEINGNMDAINNRICEVRQALVYK